MPIRVGINAIQGSQPDSAAGNVNDPLHGQVIQSVVNCLKIREQILNLPALIEINASDYLIGDTLHNHFLFENAGLGVRAVEQREVMVGSLPFPDLFFDFVYNSERFLVIRLVLNQPDRSSLGILRPQ